MRWSPPEQKEYPPSRGEGPFPVRMIAATSGVQRAASIQRYSSSTVCGRKALRMAGRSKAIRTTGRSSPAGAWSTSPREMRRWKVMSVKGSPGRLTSRQRSASKVSETKGRVLTRWKLPPLVRQSHLGRRASHDAAMTPPTAPPRWACQDTPACPGSTPHSTDP